MKLRIKFSKHGVLKFIGHLDVMRYFQKAIRRAGIDICYSSGFSPHQVMSFAAPLGVGLESNGEYMDIEVNSIISTEVVKDALNKQMVDGIEVLEVTLLPDNAGNAMASVAAAAYTIKFREEYKPEFLDASAISRFYKEQEEIIVTKKTKRSESTFDIKPFIYKMEYIDETAAISLTVDASSANNIKPTLVMKAFYEMNNAQLDEFGLLITREETYMNVGDEENRVLKPLGYIGN